MPIRVFLITLIFSSVIGCTSLPVESKPLEEGEHVLTYQKKALDSLPNMRLELMMKAQQTCEGAFTKVKEFPDPVGLFAMPSMELNWRIKCIN